MPHKLLLSCSIILTILTILAITFKSSHKNKLSTIDNMPLVHDDIFSSFAHGAMPIEQRNSQVRKWLSVGVKINVKNASGSGTIIYYNEKDGFAYIQSCGHLWEGNMTAEEGSRRKIICEIITWYHNDIKLTSPKTYSAEVLFYSNSKGRDCSLLKFTPDWNPDYLPIAPEDFEFTKDLKLHSVGCDGGNEVAHYDVRYVGMRGEQWPDLVTTENSPRPGRSGGGLMNDSFYVGICWGTSSFDGSGNGFFTPLKTIRDYNKMNGYGWLNEIGDNLVRQIPIVDRNNPQNKYPKDYLPLPSGK